MKPTKALRAFLMTCTFFAAATGAYAQTWKGTSSTSWNTGTNWSGLAVPAASAAITFDGTGTNLNTATNARFTLNSITFSSGQTSQVVINTTAGAVASNAFTTGTGIRFNSGTNISVAAGNHKLVGTGINGGSNYDVLFNGAAGSTHAFDIASGASFEIQGRITSGSNTAKGFQKTGDGTLILSGPNGGGSAWVQGNGFAITQGVLRFATTNAGGNSNNNYTVSSGAALELNGGITSGLGNGTYTLNGTGIGSNGALRSISGTNSVSGSGTGGVSLGTTSTSIGVDAGSLTISTVVKGAGGLTKVGSGTLTLSNTSNNYSGATLVSGGSLAVNGALTATTDVTVGSGGTLQGSGTINSSVTIQSGGILAPGNSIESLGGGAVSFLAGSTYAYEIQTSLFAGTPNDAADLTYSTGTLDIAAGTFLTLTDLATSTALADGSKLTLISYLGGWTSGELFTYNAATLADNSVFTIGANQWLFDYDDTAGGPNFSSDQTGATRFVTMTVVPEPAAALLGSIGFFVLLRRRRK